MRKRMIFCVLLLILLMMPVSAEPITWVDFSPDYDSMAYALNVDISTAGQEKHVSWIDILALASARNGGKCTLDGVKQAAHRLLESDLSPQELAGSCAGSFRYYREAYDAALGGLVGNFAVLKDGAWVCQYGLKAFSPIAEGFSYAHYADFGASRSFGYARRHLGNDLMGQQGTPIAAVEGGVVEALGWNRYGGWRIGIRSFDSRRYYYYAHLMRGAPYAPGLKQGDIVLPGQIIGFMGRTGYSDQEDAENIDAVHLHFGLQLIFDESQKECNSEIWIDVYQIVRLLDAHRVSCVRDENGWQRVYPFRDLDEQSLVTEKPNG